MKRVKKLIPVLAISVLILSMGNTVYGETKDSAMSNEGDNISLEQEVVQKVELFKTPVNMGNTQQEVFEKAEIKYEKAKELVEEFFIVQGIYVSGDLNDEVYQELVKSLGSTITSFKTDERELILDFVKFIDLYENYRINERIIELKSNSNKGIITMEEVYELESYMPADELSTEESNVAVFEPFVIHSNGYDTLKARDYAYGWTSNTATLRNNSTYPYYSNYYNCTSCWNDCTNFVSQVLKAGGMKYRNSPLYGASNSKEWYYSNSKPSHTWGGAHNFYLHWKVRAGVTSSSSALATGDVVNADFAGDGHIDHTAVITNSTSSTSAGKKLTQHTADKEELTSLADWYNSGYKVYGYEMDKAGN